MLRRLSRFTLAAASLAVVSAALPATAAAQVNFYSCASPGLCGLVWANLTGSLLSVRVQNLDASFGSALYSASIFFANNIGTTPGSALNAATTASTIGPVTSIGTTMPGGNSPWAASGIGATKRLDIASFFNVYIEGTAASPYRASPGDPDNGTWVTNGNAWDSFVQFNADLSGIAGVSGNTITELGFATDQGEVSGAATTVTPEPGSILLLATGLVGLAIVPLRRRQKR